MDDDTVLKDRTKSIFTENIEEPIDYYDSLGIKPRVIKFTVGVYPIINGIPIHYSPILYEKGDTLDVSPVRLFYRSNTPLIITELSSSMNT